MDTSLSYSLSYGQAIALEKAVMNVLLALPKGSGFPQLSPGSIVGMIPNRRPGPTSLAYLELKHCLMGLPGMDAESLEMGHCPEPAYTLLLRWCDDRKNFWRRVFARRDRKQLKPLQ